jgi:hypothetical protein
MGRPFTLLTIAFTLLPSIAHGQQTTDFADGLEREPRFSRGAGLRLGHWEMRGPAASAGASSQYPAFEVWQQRNLGRHFSIDHSIAFWGRRQIVQAPSGPFSEPSPRHVGAFIIPVMASLQLHPSSDPAIPVQPFIRAGAGPALGIETRQGGSSTLL